MGVLNRIFSKKRQEDKKEGKGDVREKDEERLERQQPERKSESFGLGDALGRERMYGTGEKVRVLEINREFSESSNKNDALLSVYEKLAKLEEITRIIDERIMILDAKVATKDSIKEISDILLRISDKNENIFMKIDSINDKLSYLRELRNDIDYKIETTKKEINALENVKNKVDMELELLEAHKKIIDALSQNPSSTIDLAKKLGYTRQYVWERLQELKRVGYVDVKKEGRKTVYYLINNSDDDN